MGNTKLPLVALRVWRARQGKTQGDVAELLGVTASMVSGWESGAVSVPVERLADMSLATGIPIAELVTDERIVRLLKLLQSQARVGNGLAEDKADVA